MLLPVGKGFLFLRIFSFIKKGKKRFAEQGGNREQELTAWSKYNKEVPLRMRVKITLRCSECKQRNYNTVKNKKNDPDRLTMNKYCPFCRKHTVHSETK